MQIALSNPTIPGNYTNQVKSRGQLTTGYEMGALALQNPAGGLLQQLWTVTTDGSNIFVSAPNTASTLILTDANITEVDLAFDQNMFPFLTYVSNGLIKFYWFDPTVPGFVTSTILELAITPRCTLDDKRAFDVSNSDIILVYINVLTQQLCYRIQRERYATEHQLGGVLPNYRVRCVNFADTTRLQITIDDYTPFASQNVHNGLANMSRPISITGAYIT
jgi:hypothetical protein